MNERLKELAHQADLIIKKSNGNNFRFGAMDPNLEKFGELIVRECIGKIHKNMSNDEQADLAYNAMLTAIIADIYHSFGIQESKSEKFSKAFEKSFEGGINLSGQETP